MDGKNKLEFTFDTFGLIALIFTFISVLFSFNLSSSEVILAVGVFLIILATYVYLSFQMIINEHGKEIKKLNEKINIYKDIFDLRAKVDFLFNKMGKRGQAQVVEILIRIIQIAAIVFAGYIILKALGLI